MEPLEANVEMYMTQSDETNKTNNVNEQMEDVKFTESEAEYHPNHQDDADIQYEQCYSCCCSCWCIKRRVSNINDDVQSSQQHYSQSSKIIKAYCRSSKIRPNPCKKQLIPRKVDDIEYPKEDESQDQDSHNNCQWVSNSN